ncbi:hypothetical protein MNBD_GAMMA09-3715 [hydrothermal vent metagenome]|uniref:Uncharacterized protein n=1 Tax=hydrothermal vent metagenome TaxID=652676 RepID=A0A3B0Y123_9ZZZZ
MVICTERPVFYINDIIIPSETAFSIDINQALQAQYDIGLYFMQHCFIEGQLALSNEKINFDGKVAIFDRIQSLQIETDLLIIKDG